DHPTNPKGVYAVTNLTAEKLVLVYDDVFKIKGICLRITNTYGPRHQMAHDEYGVFNWFIRKAMDNEEIPVMGDGRILRDFLYVEDLINSMIKVATTEEAYGNVFNVGTGIPVSFFDLARKIVAVAGSGRTKFTEFTQERKEVEPGDYYADITRIKKITGWAPAISLDEGITRTIDFYRQFRREYW
ncbi:MAG TPA: GDP-mannose 4,6-dehydratase, partial [Syntrophorhabdaceae bacterium]|nr:GDP-mannose 4,6-dehydratase [Syntrophorhabdaceae bacterium]